MGSYVDAIRAFHSAGKVDECMEDTEKIIEEKRTEATEKVKNYVAETGMTGKYLAEFIGISPSGVTKMLGRPFNVPTESLPRLALGLFNTSCHEFLWGTPAAIRVPKIYSVLLQAYADAETDRQNRILEDITNWAQTLEQFPRFSIVNPKTRIVEMGQDYGFTEDQIYHQFGNRIEMRMKRAFQSGQPDVGFKIKSYMIFSCLFIQPQAVDYYVLNNYVLPGIKITYYDGTKDKVLSASQKSLLSAFLNVVDEDARLEKIGETLARLHS